MVRKGKPEDIPTIMRIVKDTVCIMKEEGNDQWTEEYPTTAIFEKDVEAGSLFVLEEEGDVVGSVTVDQNEPVEYGPIPWSQTGPCYTFHRLVVDPFKRGKGGAQKLIEFAEGHAVEKNVPYMRIDTYSLNKKAQNLFVKMGYEKKGEMYFQGKNLPFYCYEKILGNDK